MYKRTAGLILTGVLATGAIGAVAMTPASATTSDNMVTSRLAHIKSALSTLVTDRTLTQAQADKVASTLDSQSPIGGMGGRGGMGGGIAGTGMTQSHDAAAKALGLTSDQLYAAVQSGKTLADVAKDQKVSVDTLVKAMVADANTDLTAAVKSGTLTQAQADTLKSSLTERITDQVNGVRGGGAGGGMGRGSRGAGWAATTNATSGGASSTPSSTT